MSALSVPTATKPNPFVQAFAESHFSQANASAWLPLRQQAYEILKSIPIPKRRLEHWKYSDLSFLEDCSLQWVPPTLLTELPCPLTQLPFPAHRVVFYNGYYQPQFSDISGWDGVCLPLSEAMTQHPETVLPYLQTTFPTDSQWQAQINLAFMTDGLWLQPNQLSDSKSLIPIHVLFITDNNSEYTRLTCPRIIALCKTNTQLNLIEEHISCADTPHLSVSLTHIQAECGSQIHHTKIQDLATSQPMHLGLTYLDQHRDTNVHTQHIALGARFAREDGYIALNGVGAHCALKGLSALDAKQQVDHHTRVDHHTDHTFSEQYYKGVFSGESNGVFNGKIWVHPKAQQTQSHQLNKNLLLSTKAQVNTKPELEIYANDVQCSHGATVGQLDQAALFYLRSRGLTQSAAQALLTEAFAMELFADETTSANETNDGISAYLRQRILKRLESLS